jgi:hypothetical protein
MNLFLSPPKLNGTPVNPTLTNWFPDPYIEANYIYLTEGERAQVTELPFHNLVTRVIWVAQRSDRLEYND